MGSLTQKRKLALDEAEKILEKVDILHLEFAKRAAVSLVFTSDLFILRHSVIIVTCASVAIQQLVGRHSGGFGGYVHRTHDGRNSGPHRRP